MGGPAGARRLARVAGGLIGCVLCLALILGGGVRAASPAPALPTESPGATGGPSAGAIPSLTGHWAIAGTSGLDLVQKGSALTGSSPMGVSLAGSVSGRQVTFRWWRGASFAAAKRADRGTGIMQLSADGNALTIAGKDEEAGKAPFPTQYAAIRVVTIIADKTPTPSWWDSWLAQWPEYGGPLIATYSRAYLEYVVVCWMFAVQTGYWPSPAVAWIEVEKQFSQDGILLVGGWLPNGGGPALRFPPRK